MEASPEEERWELQDICRNERGAEPHRKTEGGGNVLEGGGVRGVRA